MSDNIGCAAYAIGIGLILAVGGCWAVTKNNHRETQTFTVSSKERQCDGGKDGSCYYVVFGTQGEVFENTDSMLNGKWDSASMQAKIIPGKTYRVETIGWRVPFLSMKPNIVSLSEAGKSPAIPVQ